MNRILIIAGVSALATTAFAQNLFSNQSANVNVVALHASTTAASGAAAPAGGFFTELQSDGAALPNTVLNTSAGFSVHNTGVAGQNFRLADDFTVTGPGWNVSGIKVYAYATGAALPWLTGGDLNIWNGRPGDAGASVVWSSGSLTSAQIGQNTSITTNAGTGNLFRIFNSNPGTSPAGTTRQVVEFTFNIPSLTLGAGSYWIDYQLLRGTLAVFNPSTTHAGVRGVAGANGRQFNGTAWTDMLDTGVLPPAPNNLGTLSSVAQDVPFVVTGEPVPEPMTMTVLALGAVAALRRKRKA
jgi:hypothetical protein